MDPIDVLILVLCLIGGIIVFGILIACVCHRRKAQRGIVVDSTGGNYLFDNTTTVIQNGVVSHPQQLQVQPTAVVPYQAMQPPVGQTYPPQAYPPQAYPAPQPGMGAGPPPPYTETPPHQNGHNISQMDDYTALDPSLRGRGPVQQQQQQHPHSNGSSQSRHTSPSAQYSSYETPYQPNANANAGYITPAPHYSQSDSTGYISMSADMSAPNYGGSSDGYIEPTPNNRNRASRNDEHVYDYINN